MQVACHNLLWVISFNVYCLGDFIDSVTWFVVPQKAQQCSQTMRSWHRNGKYTIVVFQTPCFSDKRWGLGSVHPVQVVKHIKVRRGSYLYVYIYIYIFGNEGDGDRWQGWFWKSLRIYELPCGMKATRNRFVFVDSAMGSDCTKCI